jgi:signal transduction histidine kinase
MTESKVKTLLAATIVVVTVLPLLAAFYLLDSTLHTTLDLAFNSQIRNVLEFSGENLKTLRDADPANRSRYRAQFEEVQEIERVYAQPELARASILGSLRVYFSAGLVATLLLALGVAVLLSRRVARSYKLTFDELVAQREKVRYLQEMASWQELARILAHEIKNPLTPIEVVLGSLVRAHRSRTTEEFQELLCRTQTLVAEELGHLKRTVSRFSEFAKLQRAELTQQPLAAVLRGHVAALAPLHESARIDLDIPDPLADSRARVDATLLRQVLANVIANGVEANRGRPVHFVVRLSGSTEALRIAICNDGTPVPPELAARMFDPYISGQSAPDNMGLGLAIVKKIVIEHGGEIAYAEVDGRPTFTICLMRA